MNYKKVIKVESSATKVFNALLNNVPKWWGPQEGSSIKTGDKPKFLFWQMEIEEIIENNKLVWKCIEANHTDVPEGEKEWEGTKIIWRIIEEEESVNLEIEHVGLTPELNCYDICKPGWDYFLYSLKKYIETGSGNPVKQI